MKKTGRKFDARQRVLETAERLFYQEGIRAVGVDRIIAEAEVAKMTLYKHFPSKDDLVLGVLRYRDEKFNRFFEESIDSYKDAGSSSVEAFFQTLEDWFLSDNFRGCAFINASLELADPDHPGSIFACQHKVTFSTLIQRVLLESYGKKALNHVPAVCLLVEGAIVTAVMDQKADSAAVAKAATLAILASKQKK